MPSEESQCARCGIKVPERICVKEEGRAPKGCPTENARGPIEAAMEEMRRPEVIEFARNASIQEGEGYAGREAGNAKVRPAKPRIEEIVEFAHRMQYQKLGLAFCIGLRKEARVVDKLLSGAGFEVVSGCCKMGCNDKSLIGIKPEQKIMIGDPEPACNPIAQAYVLNAAATEFNVVVGLCVGHDSLFFKYAEAPCTVLAAKDRLLGHNPLAAIYNIDSYYRALQQQ